MEQVNFYPNNIKHWQKNLLILGKEMLKGNKYFKQLNSRNQA